MYPCICYMFWHLCKRQEQVGLSIMSFFSLATLKSFMSQDLKEEQSMTKVSVLLVALSLKYSTIDLHGFSLHWSSTDKWVQDFTTVFNQAASKAYMTQLIWLLTITSPKYEFATNHKLNLC